MNTPRIKISNEEFLQNVAGKVSEHLYVTSFEASPNSKEARWGGQKYAPGTKLNIPDTHNAYFSIAELAGSGRNNENFIRMTVLVLDDVDISTLKVKPSYVIETSPGNVQVGFILSDVPETRDIDYCSRALKRLADQELIKADKSGNNPVRWVRLPNGTNTKERPTGPFKNVLRTWEPDRKYRLPELLKKLKIDTSVNPTKKEAENSRVDKLNVQKAFEGILTGEVLHDSVIRLAAHFAALGVPKQTAEDLLQACMECCATKDSDEERWKTRKNDVPRAVKTAYDKFVSEFSNPDTPLEERPEPLNLWPDALGTIPEWSPDNWPEPIALVADDISTRMGVDPAIPAITCILVMAALISDKYKIQVKAHDTKWLEAPRLWTAIVGEPSTKKTPAINEVTAELKNLQSTEHQKYKKRLAEWEVKAKENKNKDIVLPAKPQPRKYYVNDTTIEALANVLEHNTGGILSLQDELTGWFGSMDCYRKGAISKDRPAYLSAYNGGPLFIDRASKPPLYIENFSVSILGGIQPGPMRSIANRFNDNDGLLQRFIPVNAKPAGRGKDRKPDAHTWAMWGDLCEELARGHNETPRTFKLSKEAQRVIDDARSKIQDLGQHPGFDGRLQSALQKCEGQLARLTLIFHMIENRKGQSLVDDNVFPSACVDAVTALKASNLFLRFFIPHLIHFYNDVIGVDDSFAQARLVAGFVLAHRKSRVTKRDIYRAHREFRKEDGRKALQEVMAQLELAAWVSTETVAAGKHPSAWVVNPRVHTEFYELAKKEKQRREAIKEEIRSAIVPNGT